MRESGLAYQLIAPDETIININNSFTADGYYMKYDGLLFQTGARMEMADRAQQHGSYIDPSHKTGMTGSIEIMLLGSTAASRQSLQDNLVKVLDQLHGSEGTGRLVWEPQDGSAERAIFGLQLAEAYQFAYHAGMMKSCHILLSSEKPYAELSTTTNVDTSTVTSEGSGWEIPLTIPFTLVTGGGGLSTVQNSGSVVGYPVMQVYGPINNFTIANLTDGYSLTFSGSIADGDYWTIDLFERTVLDAAGNNVIGTFDAANSQWFGFRPGNVDMQISGAGTGTNTKLRVLQSSYWG